MSSSNNKGLFLGVAAAAIAVGTGMLCKYIFSSSSDEAAEEKKGVTALESKSEDAAHQVSKNNTIASKELSTKDELTSQGLIDVKKKNDTLEPQYVLNLLNFLTKQALKRCRDQALEQRRKCLTEENWDEYRRIVKDQYSKEDKACRDVMSEILAHLPSTTAQEIKEKMASLAKDPMYSK